MSANPILGRWLRITILFCCGMLCSGAYACTTLATATIDLGARTSFEAATEELAAGAGGSGLVCPGLLTLLTSQHIYLSVDSMSSALTNSVTGDTIPYEVITIPGAVPLVAGTTTGNIAGGSLLTLLGTTSEALLYVNLGAAPNVSAGTYTATVTLRWHYATCGNLGAAGACALGPWTTSPGITQSCVLGILCTINQSSVPGPGLPVTLTINLTITNDCRFSADDIDFGSAPFVEGFEDVTGALRIRCTKGSTYTVGLGNGLNFANNRRRMASGANRLEYDVFHPGGQRWDTTLNRAVQSTPAQGNLPEVFVYEARIYPDQTSPPVGLYTDTLVIDVNF
jgi:spore coat protein U-like protein